MHWTLSQLLLLWHSTHPSNVPLRRIVFASFFAIILAGSFCILNPAGPLGLFGAPLSTLWAIALGVSTCLLVRTSIHDPSNPTKGTSPDAAAPLIKAVHVVLLILSVPVLFEGSNVVARARYARVGNALLFDELFLALDTAALGWAFPRGQFSLWLDTNEVIGVTTWLGRAATEVLQVLYVSYYLWGNGLMIYLLYRYFKAATSAAAQGYAAVGGGSINGGAGLSSPVSGGRGLTSSTGSGSDGETVPSATSPAALVAAATADTLPSPAWSRLALTVAALTSTFHFNFLLNLVLPAVSPRIYIEDEYVNPVRGLLIADILRGAVGKAAARSFSAFPSGHCGLSWSTALAASRLRLPRLAPAALIAAVGITTATLTLRYHYAADAVGALLLFAWARAVGLGSKAEEFDAMAAGVPTAAAESEDAAEEEDEQCCACVGGCVRGCAGAAAALGLHDVSQWMNEQCPPATGPTHRGKARAGTGKFAHAAGGRVVSADDEDDFSDILDGAPV